MFRKHSDSFFLNEQRELHQIQDKSSVDGPMSHDLHSHGPLGTRSPRPSAKQDSAMNRTLVDIVVCVLFFWISCPFPSVLLAAGRSNLSSVITCPQQGHEAPRAQSLQQNTSVLNPIKVHFQTQTAASSWLHIHTVANDLPLLHFKFIRG